MTKKHFGIFFDSPNVKLSTGTLTLRDGRRYTDPARLAAKVIKSRSGRVIETKKANSRPSNVKRASKS